MLQNVWVTSYVRLFVTVKEKNLQMVNQFLEDGNLKNKRINVFQNLYGHNIRANKGDPKAMSKAVKAPLKHYSSTKENPQHDDCPSGPKSWCSYQRDLANGTTEHRAIQFQKLYKI